MIAALAAGTLLAQQASPLSAPRWSLTNRFGRDDVALVDWEGHIANPAIQLTITPDPTLYLPAKITLSADGGRLMFDLHSEVTREGPRKVMFIEDYEPIHFWMSIAPDRNGDAEKYRLTVEGEDANKLRMKQVVPVEVIDQDQPTRPLDFHVKLDFSHDETGFFADPFRRMIAKQGADDWAYYLGEQGFDDVPVGAAKSWIWDQDGFKTGREVTNTEAYNGFLLYLIGIHHEEARSGAEASDRGDVQMRNGQPTGICRSGTVCSEISGNWNGLGWQFSADDNDWYASSNMRWEPHDFYSVVRHEMAHSFVYHVVHPAFKAKMQGSRFVDPQVRAYVGHDPEMLAVEHFTVVDPASKVGVMGNEYGGDMPRGRWFLTKFDLLVAQAMGYRLRETTPFIDLANTTPNRVNPGDRITVKGGVPVYDFRAENLPNGLSLNRRTGELTGNGSGTARITVEDSLGAVITWNQVIG